jgi:hypothetical protein
MCACAPGAATSAAATNPPMLIKLTNVRRLRVRFKFYLRLDRSTKAD